MALGRVLAVMSLAAIAALVPVTAASANTLPNPYTPAGSSWVDVPAGERVYFESFGNSYDDDEIYYIGAGITCTSNAVTATGPFLTAVDLTDTDCVDGTSAPFDPIDVPSRLGAVPFGFPINFFGTTYTSAYPNTNGGIFFDAPDSDYDETLSVLAGNAQSSAMFPLGADLYYTPEEANFWVAQTTVDGAAAVVFSWEKFHNCCDSSPSPDDMSFQLVLVNAGSGDFNAWFNYASLAGFDQGYTASTALIDLGSGVTAGSNVLVAKDVTNVPTVCTEGEFDEVGTATDQALLVTLDAGFYFKVDDAAARTLSIWSDDTCTTPIPVNALQDEATDLKAYLQLVDSSPGGYDSIAIGWGTYNPITGAIDATELMFNIDGAELIDGAANPLVTRAFNSTTAGRFIIGQRGGSTVTDPGALGIAAVPALAATGTDLTPIVVLAGSLLLLGGGFIGARMMRRRAKG